MRTQPAAPACYTGTYPGRLDQVRHVRRAIANHLAGSPVVDDAVLIASELVSNAILHSASRGDSFIIRAELYPDYAWIEAQDLGGPWRGKQSDDRPHGLDVIEALTGPDGWGTELATGGGRIVWARLDVLPAE
jgi:anti-sigma regulatory factor (Ser/Thr protein kinase)